MINKKEFNSKLKAAKKAEQRLNSACESLAALFEPYFNDEISVFWQQSDGFVILHNVGFSYNEDIFNPHSQNTSVIEAFENINKKPDYYGRGNKMA